MYDILGCVIRVIGLKLCVRKRRGLSVPFHTSEPKKRTGLAGGSNNLPFDPEHAPALRLRTKVDGVMAMEGDSKELFSWEWVVMYLMLVADRGGERKRGV